MSYELVDTPAGLSSLLSVTSGAARVAIDTEANTLSVRSPNDSIHVLEVQEPRHREALRGLEVGDLLEIQFRRVLAVRVLPQD